MGTNSRERRKAKQKAQVRRQAQRQRRADEEPCQCPDCQDQPTVGQPQGPADRIAALIWQGVQAVQSNDVDDFDSAVLELAKDEDDRWPQLVVSTLLGSARARLRVLWSGGWQPNDVVRVMQRLRGARPGRMVRDIIAGQRREYATATVSEAWDAQLAALEATVWWSSDQRYFDEFRVQERLLGMADVYADAIGVLYLLGGLPPLAVIAPVPGTARRGSLAPNQVPDGGPDQRMLDKVRALLAKAEATTYPEEADALTAKAQELMTRHSIDYALLAIDRTSRTAPIGVRVGIDNPYADAKTTLLTQVALANGCKAIHAKLFGFVTVVGFPGDVAATELLFTSLLVQATSAMMLAGSRTSHDGRSRTRSFRQSFLTAYALRIGERLRAASEEVSRNAAEQRGVALVPVLAAKREAVDEAFTTMFQRTTSRAVTITNQDGWIHGTAAADLANVNLRDGIDTG
jgi:hypothetical protein